MAENMRPVRFNFGGDGGQFDTVFDGFTDDTYWNGFLNVWVTPEEYRERIRPIMCPRDAKPDECVEDLDASATVAESWVGVKTSKHAMVSFANCFTTCEITPEPATDILGDVVNILQQAVDDGPPASREEPDDEQWAWVEAAKEDIEKRVLPRLATDQALLVTALQAAYGVERLAQERYVPKDLIGGLRIVITNLEKVIG